MTPLKQMPPTMPLYLPLVISLLVLSVLETPATAQKGVAKDSVAAVAQTSTDAPAAVVLGYGVGLFRVDRLLVQDDFDNLDHWVVQIQEKSGGAPAVVEARDNTLNCLLPGRGCTIWHKHKLKTRIAITYNVLCPTHQPPIKGVVPRDINQFWLASDVADSDATDPGRGLFARDRYTGAFKSYEKMRGYYASTGGRNNRTTRMRRYPRQTDGQPVEHIALSDKDDRPGFLITPDKVMAVQLVAYDDVIQYIVDGKLIYQIKQGDTVQIETRDERGKTQLQQTIYDLARFPIYREGFFGFRMVSTHHVYSNFQVYALAPLEN